VADRDQQAQLGVDDVEVAHTSTLWSAGLCLPHEKSGLSVRPSVFVATFRRMADSGEFRVFISWSGVLAKNVATVWRDLIKESFDAVTPFMSEEDIGAGERNLSKIAAELADTNFGVVVITQANQNSPWINFEAGALSKNFADTSARVAPSLVDFERKSDVAGPMGQFQAGLLDQEGVEYILVEIAKVMGLPETPIRKRFANSWTAEYKDRFSAAKTVTAETPHPAPRPMADVLDEVLTAVRAMERSLNRTQVQSLLMEASQSDVELAAMHVLADAGLAPSSKPVLVLKPGDAILHKKHGLGRVESVKGTGVTATSVVAFEDGSRVNLMHNRAPIQKLRD